MAKTPPDASPARSAGVRFLQDVGRHKSMEVGQFLHAKRTHSKQKGDIELKSPASRSIRGRR